MTQPNQFVPEGAANATSLAAFAGMTEDDWKERQRATISASLGKAQEGFSSIGADIATTIDNIVKGLFGWSGASWRHEDALRALEDQAATTAALSAAILGLDPGAVFIDFAELNDASTLGADWDQTYSGSGTGTWGIEGGRATWDAVHDAPRSCVAVYNAGVTTGNYQTVAASMATSPFWFNTTAQARNRLFGRMNAAGTSYVYADLGKYDFELGCVVSGVKTVWELLPFASFKSNAVYWLECGTDSGERVFRILEDTTVLLEHTEVGTTSQLGNDYRYCGMGVSAYATIFGTSSPGRVSAFAFSSTTPGS
ncbi:MAG: DUF7257 domain-containing protein [Mycobacterium sp.]